MLVIGVPPSPGWRAFFIPEATRADKRTDRRMAGTVFRLKTVVDLFQVAYGNVSNPVEYSMM
jgi:hypothetical protein